MPEGRAQQRYHIAEGVCHGEASIILRREEDEREERDEEPNRVAHHDADFFLFSSLRRYWCQNFYHFHPTLKRSNIDLKMGSSEKFCLRWNDFQDNISVAFRELRNDTDFFDVTLACSTDDGSPKNSGHPDRDPGLKPRHKTVRAHKVILSACSVFFKDLLRSMNSGNTSQTQPLIYLRGIRYEDLQSILDFMYYGEVNIEQEKLNTFLAVAEELRVKGLSPSETGQGGGGSAGQGESSTKRPFVPNRSSPLVNSAKKARLIKRAKEEGVSAIADIKTEMRDTSPELKDDDHFVGEGSSSQGQFHSAFAEGFGGDQSLDAYSGAEDYLDQMNDGGDGGGGDSGADGNNKVWRDLQMEQLESGHWRCNICNQEVQYRHSLQRHIESKHMHCEPIPCPYCDRSFNTKNSIQTHISKYHRNAPRI